MRRMRLHSLRETFAGLTGGLGFGSGGFGSVSCSASHRAASSWRRS